MKKFDFSVIRNLRKKWGLSAEELARRAHLTRATVAKIEGGDGNPTMETIQALSGVFQLPASELVRLAETVQVETARTTGFGADNLKGTQFWFPDFELYHLRAGAGVRKEADLRHHDNTAEVCLVLHGKVRAWVSGSAHDLGPGMAVRFKALHEHYFDVLEDAEFLLIHHSLV